MTLICQMKMVIAPTLYRGYRINHNNACQVSSNAGCLAGIQHRVNSDNSNKACEGVILKSANGQNIIKCEILSLLTCQGNMN